MSGLVYGLVGVLGLERLVELVVNRRNQERLLEEGGRLVEGDGYRAIVAVHAAWFVGVTVEATWAPWAGLWRASLALAGLAAAGEALRLWAIGTLGERWTTRVVVVPGEEPVREGPYRVLEHPNYVGVALVLFAVPLAFGLWVTAVAASVANALALRYRVRVEADAWERIEAASSDAA